MRGKQYLKKPGQYASVYSGGKSWVGKLIVLKARTNGLEFSRYGFSISRRVGGAVVRNQTKRRLREILRRTPLKAGWDLVFIVRPAAAAVSYDRLRDAIGSLLARARLIASATDSR